MWDAGGLNILIPKRRGTGYLKVPYGHHAVKGLSDIESSELVDMDGLDGYLTLEYRYVHPDEQQALVDRVMPKLAKHFKFTTWRESAIDFWKVVIP